VLLVPGYGMNAFIFGYHPRGHSMERSLADAGFEVWSVDLRAQGASRPLRSGALPPSLLAYVQEDLPTAIEVVLRETGCRNERVHLVGCSLGGSVAYAHLALAGPGRVASLVAIGAPLRWTEVHPALRLAFGSPRLMGVIRVSGTRRLAQRALPLAARLPELLRPYMNTTHVDLDRADRLAEAVEDPQPLVNRDLARWMRAGDLELGGCNVAAALARVDLPLLILLSNRDGIVPEAAALSARDAWGASTVDVLRVGDRDEWFAHADLFIANSSPKRVFEPIARWLEARE
jgi:pimeloyl-ACP methyl ester carboxylesterase